MMKVFVFVFLLITTRVVLGGKALVSQFNDGGVAASGSILSKYPANLCMERKRCLHVYPAAVHSSMVRRFRFKVLELQNPKSSRRIFVHITDECDKKTSSCAHNNKKANGMGGLLIDVHQMAMKPLGLKSWTLYRMRYRDMGKIPPGNMMKVLSYEGKKRYVPSAWKLSG